MAAGHGGRRIGAGRKPTKPIPFRATVRPGGQDDGGVPVLPPEDLPSEQRSFWQEYAWRAVEKGTLTVHTVGAFRLLCEMDAERRATKATIDQDGRTYLKVVVDGSGQEHQELKAHPLTASYSRLAKDVRTGLQSFGLAPFGKPEPTIRKRQADSNPFAALGGK